MNVGELKTLIDNFELSDSVEIKIGNIAVKEVNFKNNSLILDLDYSKTFYTANGEIYTYEYIINKLKRLNYYEYGEPISLKHITSIGITTAENFYMIPLEKIQSTGDKLTVNEFMIKVDEIDDFKNYELYVNEFNEVTNVLVDNVNKRIVFLSRNALAEYYDNRHKELVIGDAVNGILSQGITEIQQVQVEVMAQNLDVTYDELKECMENKGITIVPFLESLNEGE